MAKIENPIIFLDLDNVLANMEKGYEKAFGKTWKSSGNDEKKWAMVGLFAPDLFKDLEMMPDALELLDGLKGHPFKILTGIPSLYPMPQSVDHKIQWSFNNLKKYNLEDVLFGPYSRNKKNHCKGPNFILIDDNGKNCRQWTEAGGVAILHKSAKESLTALREYVSL